MRFRFARAANAALDGCPANVRECLDAACNGSELSFEQGLQLATAHGGALDALIAVADSLRRQTVGETDLTWRGVIYDVYMLQKVTGFHPVLSPPSGDPLYIAVPN